MRRKFITLYRQFGLFRTLGFVVSEVVRRVTDPHAIPSYSQTGEDRIIDYLLDHKWDTYYVDIGCHKPTALSNTFRLYRRGGRGLAVDGNPVLVKEYQ